MDNRRNNRLPEQGDRSTDRRDLETRGSSNPQADRADRVVRGIVYGRDGSTNGSGPFRRLPDTPIRRLPDTPTRRLPDTPTRRLPDTPTRRLPDTPVDTRRAELARQLDGIRVRHRGEVEHFDHQTEALDRQRELDRNSLLRRHENEISHVSATNRQELRALRDEVNVEFNPVPPYGRNAQPFIRPLPDPGRYHSSQDRIAMRAGELESDLEGIKVRHRGEVEHFDRQTEALDRQRELDRNSLLRRHENEINDVSTGS